MSKHIRKIYKTTDGFFNGRNDTKKPRYIVCIAQREKGSGVVR